MAATAATCLASRLITLPVFVGTLLSSCGRHTRLAWIFHRPGADIALIVVLQISWATATFPPRGDRIPLHLSTDLTAAALLTEAGFRKLIAIRSWTGSRQPETV